MATPVTPMPALAAAAVGRAPLAPPQALRSDPSSSSSSSSFRQILSRANRSNELTAGGSQPPARAAGKAGSRSRDARADRRQDQQAVDETEQSRRPDRAKKRSESPGEAEESATAAAARGVEADDEQDTVDPREDRAGRDDAGTAAVAPPADAASSDAPAGEGNDVAEDATGGKLTARAATSAAADEAGGADADSEVGAGAAASGAGFELPEELTGDASAADAGEAPAPPVPTTARRAGGSSKTTATLGHAGLGEAPQAPRDGTEGVVDGGGADGAGAVGGPDPLHALAEEGAGLEALELPSVDESSPAHAPGAGGVADRLMPPPPAELANPKSPSQARDAAGSLPPVPELPPEVRFGEMNHDKVVTGVRAELLPNGGSMNIRLDPPELGDLLVSVSIRDGVMTAAFQTSNEKATSLLSHSLSDLKSMLESQGVHVDRLHVQQAPKDGNDTSAGNSNGSQQGQSYPSPEDREAARREQQRKDTLERMWAKLMGGGDPLDLVA